MCVCARALYTCAETPSAAAAPCSASRRSWRGRPGADGSPSVQVNNNSNSDTENNLLVPRQGVISFHRMFFLSTGCQKEYLMLYILSACKDITFCHSLENNIAVPL